MPPIISLERCQDRDTVVTNAYSRLKASHFAVLSYLETEKETVRQAVAILKSRMGSSLQEGKVEIKATGRTLTVLYLLPYVFEKHNPTDPRTAVPLVSEIFLFRAGGMHYRLVKRDCRRLLS